MSQELTRNFLDAEGQGRPGPVFPQLRSHRNGGAFPLRHAWALQSNNDGSGRSLDVSVRVGSPKLDNYHRVQRPGRRSVGRSPRPGHDPIEDNVNSIKRLLWLDTDRAYRMAAERLIRIKTNSQVRVAEADDSDDFSSAPPWYPSRRRRKVKFDAEAWRDRVRKLSARFQNYPSVLTSHVTVSASHETKYFVNTEGTRIVQGRGFARMVISASAKATDGTDLETFDTFEAVEPDGLPDDKTLLAAIDRVANDASALLKAPEAEPFVGPAISRAARRACSSTRFSATASRATGRRMKAKARRSPRASGTKVLPDFLSVMFDPTRRKIDGIDLNGWYDYDDEGVKGAAGAGGGQGRAEDVPDVAFADQGLRPFQRPRAAAAGLRGGFAAIEPDRGVDQRGLGAKLRQMLIEEVKRQNKPYGLYFRGHHRRIHHHRARRVAGVQGDSGDRVPRVCRRPAGRTGARRGHRGHAAGELRQDSGHLATRRKCSTDIAARNPATCRCRRFRRRFWFPKSRSRRKPSPTTGRRCFPNRPAWRAKGWRDEEPCAGCRGGRGGGSAHVRRDAARRSGHAGHAR